ncbi:MAG TPA: heparinase II/III family protein [Candidatus Lumbricidophila sp.]|nr:heparinase II/III family protein [Candidatus Lumbricidophila sp.]
MSTSTIAPGVRGPLAEAFVSVDIAASLIDAEQALPVPVASDRAAWASIADAHATVDRIMTRVAAEREMPWPQPLASDAARCHRDGDRSNWEDAAFARQARLSRAVVAAAITLDDADLDEVANGITLVCEQSTWCWPAHDEAHAKYGSVVPVIDDPVIDLGVGEMVAQLAWADHVLGAQLDDRYPGLRRRIRYEAKRRVFDPFLERRDWWWIGHERRPSNWNAWIHSNLIVAAARLLDGAGEAALRAQVIATAVEGMDRYLAVLPADGAIDEGYDYWWQGACRALEGLAVLAHVTAGAANAFGADIPAVRNVIAFPHRMQLGGDWFVNVADAMAKSKIERSWAAPYDFARRVGDTDAMRFAASHRVPSEPVATEQVGLGRLLVALADREWAAAAASDSPLPVEVWLPSVGLAVVRERAGSEAGLAIAVKGGHNAEHHNHNDVGSFIVASDGVPFIVDAGRTTYTAQTFGPNRYDIWSMQSSWHSVPEVRGVAQSAGERFAARDAHPVDGGLSLDLADAYRMPGLHSWRRTVRLDRAAPARVVIDDAWDLDVWTDSSPEPPTSVRMLLAGEVRLGAGAAYITPLEGAPPAVIRWPGDVAATSTVLSIDDPLLTAIWGASLTRLELDVTDRRAIKVTVESARPIDSVRF